MNEANILIIEDERDISEILEVQLNNEGHSVKVIPDGAHALEWIQNLGETDPIDLFVLDWMLPNTSGIEICKFLRMFKKTKNKPILMLTAMTRPDQIVEGLDAGADDYVTKPFDNTILKARIRSLLRRGHVANEDTRPSTPQSEEGVFNVNQLRVDTNQCKAWIEDRELDLTLSEYKLLCAFLQQPGKVYTRNQLVEYIQDGPVHVTDRTIDTHIFGLRKKLKDYSKLVETIRGIGYRVTTE